MKPPPFRKLANAGWLLAERGVGLLIAFFVMTLVDRHLGPATFGAYAYVFGLVALFVPLSKYGLETIVMRDVGRAPQDRGEIIGTALALQVAVSLLAYALAAAFIARNGGLRFGPVPLLPLYDRLAPKVAQSHLYFFTTIRPKIIDWSFFRRG